MTESAPAHVREVRRLVFDPLTKTQQQQVGCIAERVLKAIDPSIPQMAECLPAAEPASDTE